MSATVRLTNKTSLMLAETCQDSNTCFLCRFDIRKYHRGTVGSTALPYTRAEQTRCPETDRRKLGQMYDPVCGPIKIPFNGGSRTCICKEGGSGSCQPDLHCLQTVLSQAGGVSVRAQTKSKLPHRGCGLNKTNNSTSIIWS